MAASENRLVPELNEKKVIELLENATPGSIKKPQNVAWKYVKVKTWKLYLYNLSFRVSQAEAMIQVETIYTFKNFLYIAHLVSSHKIEKQLGGVHCSCTKFFVIPLF